LSKAGIRSIRVRSAGTGTPGGRLPPEKFRRVFERFGLSVDNHRSRGLDKEEIARADMVIYMDSDNLANLRRLGFQPAKSWHYLGAFAADKKMKIPDPVNAAPQDAVRIFDYVEHCVACLAEVLQASPSQSPVPKDP
jgi:protein-tyrosine-phosphatase